jgi:hypothetical protein
LGRDSAASGRSLPSASKTGPDQVKPTARGIRPQTLRDDAVLREPVDVVKIK